jgi:hypothetical protein
MESWSRRSLQEPQEEEQQRPRCRKVTTTTSSPSVHSKWLFGLTVSSMILYGGFLAVMLTLASSYCDAFVTSTRILSNNHLAQSIITTKWWKQQPQQLGQLPPNHRIASNSRRRRYRSTVLHVAKSGGKMIDTEEQFSELVLAKDVPRPVMVFFSAPWYVCCCCYCCYK